MKITGIIITVLVVIAVGGSILLATETWNPEWNPFVQEQGAFSLDVIEQAITNLSETETASFEVNIEVGMENPNTSILINILGKSDETDEEIAKRSMDIGFVFTTQDPQDESDNRAEVNASIIIVDKQMYFKLSSISMPDFPLFDISLLDSVLDKWVMLDLEELQDMISGVAMTTITPDQEVAEAFAKDLIEMVKDNELFSAKEYFGEEDVRGALSDHYSISVSKDGLKKVIPEYFALLQKHNLIAEDDDTMMKEMEEQMPKIMQSIDDAWDTIGDLDIDVWVEKAGKRLNRVNLQKQITEEQQQITEEQLAETTGGGSADIEFDITFFDFNEPVTIEEPTEFMTLDEIVATLFSGFIAPIPDTIE